MGSIDEQGNPFILTSASVILIFLLRTTLMVLRLFCMLYSNILLVLIVVLELERIFCMFAPAFPFSPAQIITKVEPHKFLELAWTVIWKIRVRFLHISRFNWILVMWFRVPTLVIWFTNNFKHLIRLCKLDIFQDVYRSWNRLSCNWTVNSSSYTSQGTWREICFPVCFHLGKIVFAEFRLVQPGSRFKDHSSFFASLATE